MAFGSYSSEVPAFALLHSSGGVGNEHHTCRLLSRLLPVGGRHSAEVPSDPVRTYEISLTMASGSYSSDVLAFALLNPSGGVGMNIILAGCSLV